MNRERERLAHGIVERVRRLCPNMPAEVFCRFRYRITKTDIRVLRQIVDTNAIGQVEAAQ